LGVVQVLLFELEHGDAFLAVGFGFCSALGVDGAFGEEICAPACDDERGPAVAIITWSDQSFQMFGYLRHYRHGTRFPVPWYGSAARFECEV
jgi:hypothetical protein